MAVLLVVRRRASLANAGSAPVERPRDTVRPAWRAHERGAGGLISPAGSSGLMRGTASPAPRVRLKLVASARVSQHTMRGVRRQELTVNVEGGARWIPYGYELSYSAR